MPESAHIISLELANPNASNFGWDQIDVIHLHHPVANRDLKALCRVYGLEEGTMLIQLEWDDLMAEIERGYYVEAKPKEEPDEEEPEAEEAEEAFQMDIASEESPEEEEFEEEQS